MGNTAQNEFILKLKQQQFLQDMAKQQAIQPSPPNNPQTEQSAFIDNLNMQLRGGGNLDAQNVGVNLNLPGGKRAGSAFSRQVNSPVQLENARASIPAGSGRIQARYGMVDRGGESYNQVAYNQRTGRQFSEREELLREALYNSRGL